MAIASKRHGRDTLRSVLALGVLMVMSGGMANAGEVSEGQILQALTPKKPLTRSLSMTPPPEAATSPTDARFIDTVRNRTTRSLSTGERQQIATIADQRPSIDLEINFDYNSTTIGARAKSAVEALGRALTNPDLKGSTFLLAGYTDAAGPDAYNQTLSERRADAVKHYLVEKFGIAGTDLVTIGYGETRLKKPDAPLDAANRRVQVVNMQNKTASK
ncbi:MAG: OmpA family protein [Rhizobiales bacterium]|nr:OmpA family protein [Hyphomicrobiales bacterium]